MDPIATQAAAPRVVVGIDVSKDRLDVAVRPSGERFAVPRDAAGLDALIARLAPLAPAAVAVEATGGFETVVAASLGAAGLPVAVVNPAQVRAFAQALGRRAKTDPIDAAVIAHFVEATRPEVRALPDQATRLLAELITRRRQILQIMVAERQRRQRLGDKRAAEQRLRKSIDRLLAALQKELSALEADIDDAVRGSPPWREKEELLASVPGIGTTIARRSSPSCPNSAPSTAARPLPSPASPLGPVSPGSGGARASLAAAGPPCAPPSSWAPWSPPDTTQTSRPSATAWSPPASPSSSPSSPPPESCSPSSTPFSGTNHHGAQKPLERQDSRLLSCKAT